ncbi:MAG: hypothetical protein QOD44_3538 [Solirubrobacteraceae bacterium]|jgi:hypothetical protein|nr:hypothetical protein [Solirubrobacteraceae bacterium]
MENVPSLPFLLSLHPVLPLRAPEQGATTLTYGYLLRLPDGPALDDNDPLLEAFSATVMEMTSAGAHDEPLQDEDFAPGRRLTLVPEGVDDAGDPMVGIWDAGGVRRAGHLPYRMAAVVAAALEHRLPMEALVLTEERELLDDRRVGLRVLLYTPAMVRVDGASEGHIARPERSARERVVLLADGSGELRWWDPSGRRGPQGLGALPVSEDLAADLERLSAEYEVFAAGVDSDGDTLSPFEREWNRETLDTKARQLWRRARAELGRRYAIGLLGPGMSRPAWSAGEVPDGEHEADVEF